MLEDVAKDGDLSRSDLQLVGQAIRNKWDIPARIFEVLPPAMLELFEDKNSSERLKMQCVDKLLKMAAHNAATDAESSDVQVNVQVNVEQSNQIHQRLIHDDPQYIDYLRADTIQGDASSPRDGDLEGTLEDGTSARAPRQGADDDREGRE